MGGSRNGRRRLLSLLPVLCIWGMILLAHPGPASAQPGFVTVDSGAVNGHVDATTGISYEADNYISTGVIANTPKTDYPLSFRTLRYFPVATTPRKNCYEIPVTANTQYLVRAFFYHGGYTTTPGTITFQLAVDSSVWTDVAIDTAENIYYVEEGIAMSGGANLSVCLIRTGDGSNNVPFISSLQIRPLPSETYLGRLPTPSAFFLYLISRLDFGESSKETRYPGDQYDRIWDAFNAADFGYPYTDVSAPAGQVFTPSDGLTSDGPPNVVMQTAMADPNLINYTYYTNVTLYPRLYVSVYFAEVLAAGGTRIIDLSGNFINPASLPISTAPFVSLELIQPSFTAADGYVNLQVAKNSTSTLGPILNGFELYALQDATPGTDATQATILATLKAHLSREVWSGDPCLPVPWVGVKCTDNQVTSIDLSSQDLTGAIPDLSGLTTLISLNLSNNSFTGLLPAWVAGLTSLKTLDVSNNQLSGPIGDEIWANKSLVTVDLSSNQFNGTIPGRLLQQLRSSMEFGVAGNVLNLSSNGLTGRIPDTLTANAGEGVFTVDLSNNGLDGPIPSSFGRLAIGALQLQNNLLEGEIGSGWSKSMPNLIFLDLSDNLLSGRIPNLLPNLLPNLRSLDLSGNRLSGKIALNFTLMPNLTFLNLSNNRLSGRIPNLPPHLLLAASFAGNPDLCGPPLQRRCRNTLVVKLAAGLVACALLFAGTCLFFAWRLRRHSKRHRQDADLIAILQGRKRANLMTLADLRKATSNFSKECQIGVGGFGEVYKGKLNDGTLVAIKKSKRQGSQRDKDQFLNEVEILSQVNHRFLVRLLGCCLANKVALLVFEFVPNGTLEEHLRSTTRAAPPLTWMERLRIALQTADALAYLHSSANPPIFHRDVKSANILLDQNMDAKVADFGISKLAPLHATHVSTAAVQGTPGYIDPEYYVSFQLTAKSDVFSFGVVLLELISGRSPLEPERGSEDASLIGVAVPLIKSGNMEEVIDPSIFLTSSDLEKVKESVVAVGALAVKCLELKSKDRPNMREVFKDLQILGLQFDASTVFDISDQGELGSALLDLENPPDDDYIEFLNSGSFHASSTTRNLSSLRKLADIEEQMGSLNR